MYHEVMPNKYFELCVVITLHTKEENSHKNALGRGAAPPFSIHRSIIRYKREGEEPKRGGEEKRVQTK
jgi:hypothetical protein